MKDLEVDRARHVLAYDANTGVLTWRNPTGKKSKVGKEAGCIVTGRGGHRLIDVRVDKQLYRALFGEFSTDRCI